MALRASSPVSHVVAPLPPCGPRRRRASGVVVAMASSINR